MCCRAIAAQPVPLWSWIKAGWLLLFEFIFPVMHLFSLHCWICECIVSLVAGWLWLIKIFFYFLCLQVDYCNWYYSLLHGSSCWRHDAVAINPAVPWLVNVLLLWWSVNCWHFLDFFLPQVVYCHCFHPLLRLIFCQNIFIFWQNIDSFSIYFVVPRP